MAASYDWESGCLLFSADELDEWMMPMFTLTLYHYVWYVRSPAIQLKASNMNSSVTKSAMGNSIR
jgi:hypothetical protein